MGKAELIAKLVRECAKKPVMETSSPDRTRWYLEEKIGEGAFSEVYKADGRGKGIRRKSAIKIEVVLPDETAQSKSEIDNSLAIEISRVKNEISNMNRLRACPYIVRYEGNLVKPIRDNQTKGYYALIMMELLECVQAKIKKKEFNFTESNILDLAVDIGRGLSQAHHLGIMHRDLKPANLFWSDKEGIYKLGDFNISKQGNAASTIAGTQDYMAPEIYGNQKYSTQADIYSFGMILYYFMNGRKFPFQNQISERNAKEIAYNMRMKGAPLPPPVQASPEFARIILKACQHDLKRRYRSMDEMLQDIYAIHNRDLSMRKRKEKHKEASGISLKTAIVAIIATILIACVSGIFVGKTLIGIINTAELTQVDSDYKDESLSQEDEDRIDYDVYA